MATNITNALDECLSAADPEAAAARYPEYEDELLTLIQTARRIQDVPQAVPSPEARADGRRRLLRAVAQKARQGLREAA